MVELCLSMDNDQGEKWPLSLSERDLVGVRLNKQYHLNSFATLLEATMWAWFFGAVLALTLFKLVKVSLFWKGKGIPYEPFYCYLYRILWVLNTKGFHEFQRLAAQRYGRKFGTYKGFTPVVAFGDVEASKEVLIKQFDNFFKRTFEFKSGEPLWDNNILNMPYDQWKSLRVAMGYAFTTSKMKHMVMRFDTISKRLVKKLSANIEANGGKLETEFFTFSKTYAVDSVLAIAYGMDSDCIENPDSKLMKYTSGALEPGLANFLFFVAPQLFKYVPFVTFPPKATLRFFEGLAKQMFKEKRARLDEVVAKGAADIVDYHLLLQREDPKLTDEILASQAFLFITAGLDPTALTMNISTYYMALYPDAQQKVLEELRSVMGNRKEVSYDDVQKLKYLEGFILESFRMFPFGAQVDRICGKDSEVCGVPIKKGWIVEILASEMMQDSRYFPKPAEFQPERFVKGESEQQQDPSAFLLFGDGPKNCVGKRLALMNSMAALANLLLVFKFEACAETPPHPPEMKPGFDLSNFTKKPLLIRVVPRT